MGQTLVLLGSSGAGKSTLTNSLLGWARQDTGAVREHDSRGKHTTTARSLHQLPSGACVIDTPGVRTLRPDVDAHALGQLFEDVSSLAGTCRFRNCSHLGRAGMRGARKRQPGAPEKLPQAAAGKPPRQHGCLGTTAAIGKVEGAQPGQSTTRKLRAGSG
jgi:energy-coupling factor transporter ATP-binding protein EcfA2